MTEELKCQRCGNPATNSLTDADNFFSHPLCKKCMIEFYDVFLKA